MPYLCRYHREDISKFKVVEPDLHDFGVWIAIDRLPEAISYLGLKLLVSFASGREIDIELKPRCMSNADLRGRILDAVGWPSRKPVPLAALGSIVGPVVRSVNRQVLANATVSPALRGPYGEDVPAISIVICVFRRMDFILRQSAIFANTAGMSRAEVIYVNNSPEMDEEFLRIHLKYQDREYTV